MLACPGFKWSWLEEAVFKLFAECERGLVLFIRLKDTLAPLFVKEDVTEALQQQAFIAHEIREVFVMCERMFDASWGGFSCGFMCLTETDERDTIQIGYFVLFDFMVKQELIFQLGGEFIHGNCRETDLISDFAVFTGEVIEDRFKLVLLNYIVCGRLVQDGATTINKRFVFLSCWAVFNG